MAYKIKAKQLDAGVGSGMYTPSVDPNTSSTLLGGAESRPASEWATYTVSQVLDELLFQYQPPSMAITQFLADGAAITTSREVGQTLTSGANVTITFGWDTNPPEQNAVPNSVRILDYKAPPALTGQPINGTTNLTYTNAELTPAGAGSRTWTARGTNTNSQDYQNSATINWNWRGYWGSSTNPIPTPALVAGLVNKPLPMTKGSFVLPETTPGTFRYFAFEEGIPSPTSFTSGGLEFAISGDASIFPESANGYRYKIVSITNQYGKTRNYHVYRSANPPIGPLTVIIS